MHLNRIYDESLHSIKVYFTDTSKLDFGNTDDVFDYR